LTPVDCVARSIICCSYSPFEVVVFIFPPTDESAVVDVFDDPNAFDDPNVFDDPNAFDDPKLFEEGRVFVLCGLPQTPPTAPLDRLPDRSPVSAFRLEGFEFT